MMDLPRSLLRPSLAIKQLFASYLAMARISKQKADLEPRQRCMRDAGVLQQSRSCLKTLALRKRLMGQGIQTSLSRFVPGRVNWLGPKKQMLLRRRTRVGATTLKALRTR